MNDLRASSTLRSLIETAKSDGPNAVRRAEVWSSVCRSVPTPIVPGSAETALTRAGAGKPISIGALFGGAVTVGLASALLILQPMRSTGQSPSGKMTGPTRSARVVLAEQPEGAVPARDEARLELHPASATNPPAPASGINRASGAIAISAGESASASAPSAVMLPSTRPSPRPPASGSLNHVPYDPLAREASLLTQARAALGQGDPGAALRAVRSAMAVPGRQLIPEELSVESQALRALGRPRDADELTTELRTRYPDSALAR